MYAVSENNETCNEKRLLVAKNVTSMQLSPGAVRTLAQPNRQGKLDVPLRLQVLGVKRIEPSNSTGSGVRWRLLLSDGSQAISCILVSHLSNLASSGDLREGTVVDVDETITNLVNGKYVVIVLNIKPIQHGLSKIGNPVTVSLDSMNGGGQGGMPAGSNAGFNHQQPAYGVYGAPPPQPQPQMHGQMHGQMYGQNQLPQPQPPYSAYGPPAHQIAVNTAPAPAQQYRPTGNGGPTVKNEAPPAITPINGLTSNWNNRWTIKARATQKSDIRRYSNARGEGKFFSFDLVDEHGGEIRVVGWNDQCDRFFDQVQVGTVYMLTKASLRPKRGNYNQTRHQFEIHLESGSQLTAMPDESAIPRVLFSFVPLANLEDTPPGVMVDVLAVVESVGDVVDITRKDGTQASKRSVTIKDASGRSIELTLWGEFVSNPGDSLTNAVTVTGHHPIIAVKNARLGDYNGKTLSTVSSSSVLVDPAPQLVGGPEAAHLRSWYDNGGALQESHALSSARGPGGGRQERRICVADIKAQGPLNANNTQGSTAWVQLVAHIAFVRNESYAYPACPLQYNGKQCNKKLIDQTGDGTSWFCERCGSSAAAPDWRYIISAQIADHSDAAWVTAFNEVGPDLLGLSAQDLKTYADSEDPRFAATFRDVQFRIFMVKLRISEETYQEETKLRSTVVRLDPVDFAQESRWTLDSIARLERGEQAYPVVTPSTTNISAGANIPATTNAGPSMMGASMMGAAGFLDGYGAPPPTRGPFSSYAPGGYGAPNNW